MHTDWTNYYWHHTLSCDFLNVQCQIQSTGYAFCEGTEQNLTQLLEMQSVSVPFQERPYLQSCNLQA